MNVCPSSVSPSDVLPGSVEEKAVVGFMEGSLNAVLNSGGWEATARLSCVVSGN